MKFLVDENLSRRFANALTRQQPEIDVVRVPEVGLLGMDDTAVLDWAAAHNRVLITKDRATIPPLVRQRLNSGIPTPLILIIRPNAQLPAVLDMIEAVMSYLSPDDWAYPVMWIP